MTALGALHGIRVVEAGLLVQGPQAAALLRQLGATVIKVELPGIGDQARWLPVSRKDLRSPCFIACNRGKRSIALDLRVPAGKEAFRKLVATADVLITNFMPGTMEAWGLGYDALRALNSRLVYASGSAFGPSGPDAGRTGADLSAQASGGLISSNGAEGDEPSPVGAVIADHIACQNLVAGVLAALIARDRTGHGQRVDVSLLGSQIWAQASEYTHYLLTGAVLGRANRGHPMIAGIYAIFPTADGWLAVVGILPHDRARFYDLVGRPELTDDPRFASPFLGPGAKAALFALLSDAFRQRPTSEWCTILGDAGLRFAPVRDHAEVARDPQVWENGYLRSDTDTEGREVSIVGAPIALSDTPADPTGIAPELGQHTEEVLLEVGYTWEEISALRESGAF